MGFEQAQEAMKAAEQAPQTQDQSSQGSEQSSGSGNGDLAPDSSSANEVLDLSKAEKFLWEGKEMTPEDLRKNFLRQQDYTKKTQAIAEEKRRFEEERRAFIQQQEETEKYNNNIDADIDHVLKDPSLEKRFKEIYPEKYHRILDQALAKNFGEAGSQKRSETLLEQRLNAIERRNQQSDMERQRTSFENEVKQHAEILDSNIDRLSQKYPHADEDSVLARAEYMAISIKKDQNFNDNFSQLMEKLYKENHQFHEKRYQQIYKQKVENQKQANTRGKDIGRGGATPATAPTKLKLKDVKHHIQAQLEANRG